MNTDADAASSSGAAAAAAANEDSSSANMSDDFSAAAAVDNSDTVLSKIAALYAERLMSDVCLIVGDVEYPAHRLILCASSDVFQVMLMSTAWSEYQETRVVLGETPECAAVFEVFLKYLYTGKIQLEYATVIPLVALADKYNVKDLLRLGLDFMTRNVAHACKRNQAVAWYQFTLASGHRDVASKCCQFIKWNFEPISMSLDFKDMEPDILKSFLECNDLVVESEMSVFRLLLRWLDAQEKNMTSKGEENVPTHLARFAATLLPHVRMPMMKPDQLAQLMLSPISSHPYDVNLFLDAFRLAMAFHMKQLSDDAVREIRNDKLFTPRLYTAEAFCASLTVEHLHNLHVYHCRSLLFSSQRSMASHPTSSSGVCGVGESDQTEWSVDLYPKGVWIQRCLTVYRPPGLEVPERVLKTVRVSVAARGDLGRDGADEQRVRIGVLVVGQADGYEHIRKVVTRNYFFSATDQIVNFDELVDYDELNNYRQRSAYLTGPKRQSFSIHVVITPLTKRSSLE